MQQSSLLRHFPPPRFLDPQYVGISFSDVSIKAVLFGSLGRRFPVKSVIIPLEQGIIVAGQVLKVDELAKKLEEVKTELRIPLVYFALPDELAYIFTTSISATTGKDVVESIAFGLEENVPLSLSDTVFDFAPLSIIKKEEGFEVSAVVAACLQKEVQKYIEALLSAGLEPLGCTHESQAIAQALIPEAVLGGVCIIQARENRIGIYFARAGYVLFSTIRSFTQGSYADELLDEFGKFLEYWKGHHRDIDVVESVVVCGDFEYAKQAVNALTSSPKGHNKAQLANVWINVFAIDEHIPDMPYEKSLSFAGAIGAALTHI